MFALFVFFCGGLIALSVWWVDRRFGPGAKIASRIAAGVAAAFAAVLLLALTGWLALYLALVQPWPVSLRQGPDTDSARELFRRHVDPRGEGVARRIHAWRQWAGPGEHVLYLCFEPVGPELAVDIIRARRLVPVQPGERAGLPRWDRGPAWWPVREAPELGVPWYRGPVTDRQAFTYFWPRLADGRACLLEVDIA